jgi:hypothetical protein
MHDTCPNKCAEGWRWDLRVSSRLYDDSGLEGKKENTEQINLCNNTLSVPELCLKVLKILGHDPMHMPLDSPLTL